LHHDLKAAPCRLYCFIWWTFTCFFRQYSPRCSLRMQANSLPDQT